MAAAQHVQQLRSIVENLKKVDTEKLFRPKLGEESLQGKLEPILTEIIKKAEFALQYAEDVHNSPVSTLTGQLTAIHTQLNTQANLTNADYITQRQGFLNAIGERMQELLNPWPAFVAAAVEKRGFLEDEGIRKEYEETVQSMKAQAGEVLNGVKAESQTILSEAKRIADEIEQRARRTAARVSVQEAQAQFKEAQKSHDLQVWIWASLSIFVIAVFLVAIWRMFNHAPESTWTWHQSVYFAAIRLLLLGTLGAVATFCMRVFRAHMHMQEQNRHRQRVANSIGSFVESAVTPEQRDLILAKLVDAVVDFGASGLLPGEEDSMPSTKLAIDSVTRNLIPPPGKA